MRWCQILVSPRKTLEACALNVLHLVAADHEVGSGGGQSPDLGDDKVQIRLSKKSPDGNVGSWTESEGTSSEQCEHNVGSLALHVVGQDQSLFLEDCELARVALSCHIALDMMCQEMHDALVAGLLLPRGPLSQQALLSPWAGCDNKGERIW